MLKRFVVVLFAMLLVCCMAACAKEGAEEAAVEEISEAGYRRTVLYYPSDEGFIVPVMKLIPWEEGIGMAALSYLKGGADNEISVSQMGLCTVLPEDAEYSLRVFDDGTARVDFAQLPEFANQEQEMQMVISVVNTLTEFPAIERVELTECGEEVARLAMGTELNGAMEAFQLNPEAGEAAVSSGQTHAVKLYFPNSTGSLNVPVVRYSAMEPTAESCVQQLMEGPANTGLISCYPGGTQLLGVSVENNVATINLSGEFLAVEQTDGMAAAAYDTTLLTLMEVADIYALEFEVEGEPYAIEGSSLSVPVFSNVFR